MYTVHGTRLFLNRIGFLRVCVWYIYNYVNCVHRVQDSLKSSSSLGFVMYMVLYTVAVLYMVSCLKRRITTKMVGHHLLAITDFRQYVHYWTALSTGSPPFYTKPCTEKPAYSGACFRVHIL